MFTGIVEETGKIGAMVRKPDSIVLKIEAKNVLEGTQLGDSIAVNGVCLTVTELAPGFFLADVMHETMRRSSLAELTTGSLVNLERAVPVGGRLGGHIVSGHIDATGHIMRIQRDGIAKVITIAIPAETARFIIEKGSITIDGISLTVTFVGTNQFSVSIIPHTMEHTTLLQKPVGSTVNIETDMIGKYIYRFLTDKPKEIKKNTLSLETLLQQGF